MVADRRHGNARLRVAPRNQPERRHQGDTLCTLKLRVVQSRTRVGIVIVVLGAIGAAGAALFGSKRASDDNSRAIGPVLGALPRPSVPAASVCRDREWEDYYYPMGIFAGPLARDGGTLLKPFSRMFREEYTASLRALKEPSLSCGKTGADESYRFLFVPSFHGTIVVRVDRTGSEIRLHTAMLSGPGGRDIVDSADLTLQKKQWDDLLARLAAAHFWESRATHDQTGIDGENWVIEGRLADRYWVVDQWSPSRSDAFGAAGIRFLELAKMTTAAAPELYAE
jgi:hypothetical protein